MNADGSAVTQVTNTAAGINQDPHLSPDSSRLIFDRTSPGNREVFVANLDGSGEVNVTNNAASDAQGVFSPDGTQIAFTSARSGNFEVHVANADGTGATNVTNNAADDIAPKWCTDNRIYVRSARTGIGDIYSMNPDGTGVTQVTNSPVDDARPDCAPNMSFILFTSTPGGNFEVFKLTRRSHRRAD